MRRLFLFFTFLLGVGMLLGLSGCPFMPDKGDPVDGIDKKFLDRITPENVLENLKRCYKQREVAEYESLLAQDFTFQPSDDDVNIPDQWGRNQEILIHTNMFDADLVQTLTLSFDVGERVFDTTDQLWTIMVTNVDLHLYGMTPHLATPKQYSVQDGTSRFWFRQESWNAPGTSAKVWSIVKWEDEPID